MDLQKGLQASNGPDKKRKHRRTEIKVTGIAFFGTGKFDNLTFSTSEHIAHFYDAAEWFVKHQDIKTGTKFHSYMSENVHFIIFFFVCFVRWLAESGKTEVVRICGT